MSRNLPIFRVVRVLVGTLICCAALCQVSAVQTTITRTNLTERWITNLIEVRMPTNLFVNEYHTNWVEQRRTNVIDAFATNRVVVNAVRTNIVSSYRTNWGTLTLTNQVAVQAILTNYVERYVTNWKTLSLTNCQTVLIMKTNWITVPVTNTVSIDLITNRVAASEGGATSNAAVESKLPATSRLPVKGAVLAEDLTLEASASAHSTANNLTEVQIKVRSTAEGAAPLMVQQWRIERTDGAVLMTIQDTIFKRALPPGKYKVEAKARRDSRSPLLAVRGTLEVSSRDAVIQQHLTAQR